MIRQFLFVSAVSLAACFPGGGNDGYDVDNYWNELGVTHCQAMRDCCTSAEYNDWWTSSDGDTIDCVSSHQAPFNAVQIRDAISAGTISFDEARAHACVEALAVQECGDFQQGYRFRETYCANPLIGNVRDGEDCLVDEECEGELCGEDGLCATRIPEGGPCFVGVDECQAPFRCNNDDGGQSFTCSLGLAPGATCTSDDECADGWCKEDTVSGSDSCLRACDGV